MSVPVSRKLSAEEQFRLADRIRRSDREAFRELFEAVHGRLHAYLYQFTRSSESAHDILQDVFLKLWTKRETLDPAKSLEGLVFTIGRNYGLNYVKRTPRSMSIEDPGAKEPATNVPVYGDNHQALIQSWLVMLPDRQREAFVLSRFQGFSHKEIAALMDVSPSTVNNHLGRALTGIEGEIPSPGELMSMERTDTDPILPREIDQWIESQAASERQGLREAWQLDGLNSNAPAVQAEKMAADWDKIASQMEKPERSRLRLLLPALSAAAAILIGLTVLGELAP